MKKNMIFFLMVMIVLILGTVFLKNVLSNSEFSSESLEFYIIKYADISNGLNKENGKLIFNDKDIYSYDKKKHNIIFKKSFLKEHVDIDYTKIISNGSKILGANKDDCFVIYIGKTKIYNGYFAQPEYSSYRPQGPVIKDIINGITIRRGIKHNDERENKKLFRFLKFKGLLE